MPIALKTVANWREFFDLEAALFLKFYAWMYIFYFVKLPLIDINTVLASYVKFVNPPTLKTLFFTFEN